MEINVTEAGSAARWPSKPIRFSSAPGFSPDHRRPVEKGQRSTQRRFIGGQFHRQLGSGNAVVGAREL
jgi:hypothetical protein